MTRARGQFSATVLANTPLCREHFRLTLQLAAFPPTAPGQFVQIACHPLNGSANTEAQRQWHDNRFPELGGAELRERETLLRRPFSLAARRDGQAGITLDIIHRVVGLGTAWLAGLNAGDAVSVLGPLGNRFALPAQDETALLIGGGVGIPPMIYLAEHLAARPAVAFAGAVSQSLLPLTVLDSTASTAGTEPRLCIEEFARHGIPAVISTDDGSFGFRGFVTQALEAYLDAHPQGRFILYTCGPEPMMRRVADIAARRNLPCQIAVERAMACGMGTCQSCCIKVKKPTPAPGRNWTWKLACTDGPVFAADALLW